MRPAENIKKLIKNAPIKTNPAVNEAVLRDLLNELDKSEKKPSAALQPNIWKIIMKSRITQLTTAAVIIIAVLVGINFLNGTTSWAEIIKAFNEVENVHFSSTMFGLDGTKTEYHMYLKRPDCFYEDSAQRIIIDNGKERLTIDKEKKTAQFSDSLLPYKPLEKHYMFKQLDLFRGENQNAQNGYEITKIEEESSDTTLVFGLHHKKGHMRDREIKAKAWVEADTMLPLKMRLELVKPEKNEPASIEMVFDYKQIPDEVFALVVPEGYEQLPGKQRGVLSGKVLDENERPVVHAIVYCMDRTGDFSEQTTTGESGQFTFRLPPEGTNKLVFMPVFVRAFCEDDPNRVAWTTVSNPAEDRDIGAEIPGKFGKIEFEGNMLKNATGIIIKMELAGSISGKVIDTDGDTIPNASVKLICGPNIKWRDGSMSLRIRNLGGIGKRGELIVQTDEHGHFEFRNIPRWGHNSSFTLIASASGYVKTNSRFKAETPLETEQIDIKLLEAGLTIRGKLIDNYGEPLSARNISAAATIDGCRSYVRAKTDEKGEFTIEGVPVSQNLKITASLSHKRNIPPHDKEKYNSYVYYPDVVVGIDYEQGKNEYEIEMIAEKPELILNIEVKNTSGEILKYFPVEIRVDPRIISSQWTEDKNFTCRTDENGRCRFTDMPNVRGLRLVLWGGNHVWHEKLSENEKIFAEEYKKKHFWADLPIEIRDGQKEYNITAVTLTRQESENRKRRKNR